MIDPRIRTAVDAAQAALSNLRNTIIDVNAETDPGSEPATFTNPTSAPAISDPGIALLLDRLEHATASEREAILPGSGNMNREVVLYLVEHGCVQGGSMGQWAFSRGFAPDTTMEQAVAYAAGVMDPTKGHASGI